MAKTQSTFLNMAATLIIVTLVAAFALGAVYEVTKKPIAQAAVKKQTEAMKAVLPEFDNNPFEAGYKVSVPDGPDSLEFYPAKKGDKLVGTAVKTYTYKGFSGFISIMVGFTPEGSIIGTQLLEHKETPGLGTKMADESFKGQFREKNPAEGFNMIVTKDGGEVQAISGATISSRAFCDAVQRAHDAYMKTKK